MEQNTNTILEQAKKQVDGLNAYIAGLEDSGALPQPVICGLRDYGMVLIDIISSLSQPELGGAQRGKSSPLVSEHYLEKTPIDDPMLTLKGPAQ